MRRIIGLLVVGLICLQVQAASFDCAKAHAAFERYICGTEVENSNLPESLRPELIGLDAELNTVYRQAATQHFDPTLLRREQHAWLKARDRCVRDKNGCAILDLYNDRIDNLRYDMAHPPRTPEELVNARLLSMGSPPGNNVSFDPQVSSNGYGFGLCEALVRWVNYTTPKGDMKEPRRTVRHMPGLEEPAWQEVDIRQHLDLFSKLIETWARNSPKSFLSDQLESVHKGKYRLWVAKEDVLRDFRHSKPETLMLFTVNSGTATPDEEQRIWGSPQIVTDDLRDVDKQANVDVMSLGGMLLRYKGKPYFISAFGNNKVFARGLSAICEITNLQPVRSKK